MIGIFDSGVGGLGIFDEIRKLMPNENILYLADTKNCPYGEKTVKQIKQICLDNSKFLVKKGVDIIVVACNTGSTIALEYLRSQIHLHLRGVTFVGVVPVVKTCAEVSKNKRIGILATKATVESKYLQDLVEKYCPSNQEYHIYYQAANELVGLVESYKLQVMNYKLIKRYLQLFIDNEVDVIALGCTHFPFLRSDIEEILGPDVKVLDSNGAVARQVQRIQNAALPAGRQEFRMQNDKLNEKKSSYQFFTSGNIDKVKPVMENLLGEKIDLKKK